MVPARALSDEISASILTSASSYQRSTCFGKGHIHPYAPLVNCFTMCFRRLSRRASPIPWISAVARMVSSYASHSMRARP